MTIVQFTTWPYAWDVPVLNASFGETMEGAGLVGSGDDIMKMDPNAKFTPHTISIVVAGGGPQPSNVSPLLSARVISVWDASCWVGF